MRYLLLSVLVFLVGILMVPNVFAQDRGDFYLTYIPTSDYPTHEDRLKDSKFLEINIENLNSIFQMPHDVEIIIADSSYEPWCEDPNAFYLDSKITICYEFIDATKYRFEQYYEREHAYDWATQEEVLELKVSLENVIVNTLYHEVGHALLDIYGLPYSGLEEDVADQFAAYFILAFHYGDDPKNEIGKRIITDAAWDHQLISEKYPDLSKLFADTHSLPPQRFYNLSCWAYGAYPNDSQWMLDQGWVTEDREMWCTGDYQKIVQFWDSQPIFHGSGTGGFEWIWILIILGVIIGVIIAVIKSRKKTAPLVQLPKITCRNCNHLNRSTAKVCAKCGNSVYHIYTRIMPPVKGKDEPKVTCRNCNHLNRSTSKFCVKCGTHV